MKDQQREFWIWFENNKRHFEKDEINNNSIEAIDQKINALGNFAWEIGPGQIKPCSLTISPGGDRKLLSITKEIISKAPDLIDWEFHYAKPVKEWDNYFEVIVDEQKLGIDISKWEYILFRSEDDMYDIQIKPDNIPTVLMNNQKELYGIAEMVLDSIIGEEKRLEKIADIEVVKEFDSNIQKNGISIIHLQDHIRSKN